MIRAEVCQLKGLGVDLVHGGGGVGHGAYFIGVKLLPPVQGGSDIHGHQDLADEFPVIAPRPAQPSGQGQVVLPQHILPRFIVTAVAAGPAVQGVSCPPDRIFQIHNADVVHLEHGKVLLLYFIFSTIPNFRLSIKGHRAQPPESCPKIPAAPIEFFAFSCIMILCLTAGCQICVPVRSAVPTALQAGSTFVPSALFHVSFFVSF